MYTVRSLPQMGPCHASTQTLHWLPVNKNMHYAIVPLTYYASHGLAPAYFTDRLYT